MVALSGAFGSESMCKRYRSVAVGYVLLLPILSHAKADVCVSGEPVRASMLLQRPLGKPEVATLRFSGELVDDPGADEAPAAAASAPRGRARLGALAQMTAEEQEEHRASLRMLSGAAVAAALCVSAGLFLAAAQWAQWTEWKSSSRDAEAAGAGAAAPAQIGPPMPEASMPLGLVGIFESGADARPGSAALVDAETGATVSYGELVKTCRALATSLQQAGIGGGDVLGLLFEPSCQFVVATIGVMQAGAAWLPLDSNSPGARLERLLGRAEVRLALAAEDFNAALVAPVPVWALGASGEVLWTPRPPPLPPRRGGSARAPGIAAVFYTSGSTGEPKAVMYGTETLCHGALTFGKLCQADSGSVFLVKTPTIWAVTEYEVFTPLAVGACAVVDARCQRDAVRLAEQIRAHGVSVLLTSAPVLQLLADERLPTLRHAVNVGAALPVEVCTAVQNAFGSSLSIHNLYGCTETPCLQWTNDPSGPPPGTTLVPAGSPQPGVEVHVLDPQGRPAALGCAGEVYIGGPYVSHGYLDDEQLTRDRFQPSPCSKSSIYRTGDVGRWLRDPRGLVVLQIEGRVDRQLNIRGVRVAPEEVEAVLSQAPGVREVASVVVGGEGSERLVACVAGGAADLQGKVLKHASSHLPSHMRPNELMLLDALPRLGNGKVDLATLTKQASAEVLKGQSEDVEAVDSLGRMRKVKRQVQHDLQVMSAVRAVATVGVIVYHWYWEHWVDYTHRDGIIVPALYPAWQDQGSWWFRVFVKGAIGIMPWTMPAFVVMSGYADSVDGMKSKLTENMVGLVLYIACYHPIPDFFMWLLRVPMQNENANLEFYLGPHRWYLVYYLLCNVLHAWVFMPLRGAVERASANGKKLTPLAVTLVIGLFCQVLLPRLTLRHMCGSAPVAHWKLTLAYWLLPWVWYKQSERQWVCTLVAPSELHLFVVYAAAWWFGPPFLKHIREAPAGRWLEWFGALLPASLFLVIVFAYMVVFPREAPSDVYKNWLGVVCCFLVIWATGIMAKKWWFPFSTLAWFGNCSLAAYIFHCYFIIRPKDTQSMTFFRFRNYVLVPPPEDAVARLGHWPGSDLVKLGVLTLYALAYMATFGMLFQRLLLMIPVLGSAAARHAANGWSWVRRACVGA